MDNNTTVDRYISELATEGYNADISFKNIVGKMADGIIHLIEKLIGWFTKVKIRFMKRRAQFAAFLRSNLAKGEIIRDKYNIVQIIFDSEPLIESSISNIKVMMEIDHKLNRGGKDVMIPKVIRHEIGGVKDVNSFREIQEEYLRVTVSYKKIQQQLNDLYDSAGSTEATKVTNYTPETLKSVIDQAYQHKIKEIDSLKESLEISKKNYEINHPKKMKALNTPVVKNMVNADDYKRINEILKYTTNLHETVLRFDKLYDLILEMGKPKEENEEETDAATIIEAE